MLAHLHFVTGRLAERSLRRVLQPLAQQVGFSYSVEVLPITVAALMTPAWIAERLKVPKQATEIWLPGYCDGDLAPLRRRWQLPIRIGPRDLLAIPECFGQESRADYGEYSIEILAEINHAPRLSIGEIVEQARSLATDGADVIDIGCEPEGEWRDVGICVRALRAEGLRVSIDSLNRREIAAAASAGAELVLSVNSSNLAAAADWGCEVVAIPDDPHSLDGLEQTVELLDQAGVPHRIDPVLEPIGCGFAGSVMRYAKIRNRYPGTEMMMGIGNITELTDVDSAGVNVLLLGICEELRIHSVLTTQVINWARTCVREVSLARRLVHYAVRHGTIPKHLEAGLIVLRDTKTYPQGDAELDALADQLKDHNIRLFAERGQLHLVSAGLHFQAADAFQLFQQLLDSGVPQVDATHAFYLGFELAKATTALTLDKQYRQDEPLDWGYLTRPEHHHRLSRQRSIPE